MKIFFIILLTFFILEGCKSENSFEMDEKNHIGSTDVEQSSPTSFHWISLETTKEKALKKSAHMLDRYYPLLYSPKSNLIAITSIGGMPTVETVLKKGKNVPDPAFVSTFVGTTLYNIFFTEKRDTALKKKIRKYRESVVNIKFSFKVTRDPEKLIYEQIIKKTTKKLIEVLSQKIGNKDYFVKTRFLVVNMKDFKYRNRSKLVSFNLDILFLISSPKKVDYEAHLEKIEEMTTESIFSENYELAQKYNEIYKKITPDKKIYYTNAYKINLALKNYIGALMSSVEMIEEVDEKGIVKLAFSQFGKVYKSKLSKRKWNKIKYKLGKAYKLYRRKRINKNKFAEKLKDIIMDYPIAPK